MSAAILTYAWGLYISFTSRFEKSNCSVVSKAIENLSGGRGLIKGGDCPPPALPPWLRHWILMKLLIPMQPQLSPERLRTVILCQVRTAYTCKIHINRSCSLSFRRQTLPPCGTQSTTHSTMLALTSKPTPA